jgi:hypothetical protein
MAQFEYLIEWQPRNADFWRVSNTTHCICKEFNNIDEAFGHIAEHKSLWDDERIWAYRFGEGVGVVLLHMENETEEKKQILKLKGWC